MLSISTNIFLWIDKGGASALDFPAFCCFGDMAPDPVHFPTDPDPTITNLESIQTSTFFVISIRFLRFLYVDFFHLKKWENLHENLRKPYFKFFVLVYTTLHTNTVWIRIR